MHRRAQQNVRRRLGDGDTVLAYAWQLQARGVLHLHLVLGFDSPREQAVAWAYVRELRRLAPEHGFGFIDARDRDGKRGRSMVMEPHRAAGYVSRYLGESAQLVQAIALAYRPQRLVYVARRLTTVTGCTRRRLRRARYLWWLRQSAVSVVRYAGELPAWFTDAREYALVNSLLAAPAAP
jgi:hypothetical protein